MNTDSATTPELIKVIVKDIVGMYPVDSFTSNFSHAVDPCEMTTPYAIYHEGKGALSICTNGNATVIMQPLLGNTPTAREIKIHLHAYFMESSVTVCGDRVNVKIPGHGDKQYACCFDSIQLVIDSDNYSDHKEEYLALFKLGLDQHRQFE